ncbi:hypothetical protein DA482_23175 [Pseudomonas fluorescens]|nr:hypothetical protein BFW91_05615 [Pseudomonas fluorescens]PQA91133.1 hypothetical protein B0A76_29045 [Pseudomonas fluorescens]RFP96866.1 hypothetical protein D0N73_06965 [Pseudomonas fluorescens]TWR49695.1 hypothetical protein FIP59_00300 [Pseudomonas fluorescens]
MHVNGRGGFCHVVRRLFECRPILVQRMSVSSRNHGPLSAIVQNALPQNAIIANCNLSSL